MSMKYVIMLVMLFSLTACDKAKEITSKVLSWMDDEIETPKTQEVQKVETVSVPQFPNNLVQLPPKETEVK